MSGNVDEDRIEIGECAALVDDLQPRSRANSASTSASVA
jgi:hypothetical protein